MQLFEYEGKQILARYGIPIPNSVLWPDADRVLSYPLVVKTQILEGGRGKRGGIRIVRSAAALSTVTNSLLRGTERLPPAAAILLEEHLSIAYELYVSFIFDRKSGCPLLLISRVGGVEIESAASENVSRFPIDALTGITRDILTEVATVMHLDKPVQVAFEQVLQALWRVFVDEDCLLVEINPLVVTFQGAFMAADARIVLDDSARPRHPDWREAQDGTAFERVCSNLGATATDLDGDIAIITSGAGLGMATFDTVVALGGRPRCLVDLGGTVFTEPDRLQEVVATVCNLSPQSLLFNYNFQLANCAVLATGIASSFRSSPPNCPVVIRVRGNMEHEARAILADFEIYLTGDMLEACARAVKDVRSHGEAPS